MSADATVVLAGLAAGTAALLLAAPRRRSWAAAAAPPAPAGRSPAATDGLLRRGRLLWAVCAGAGAGVVMGGALALPTGVAAAVATWWAATRIEPVAVRRRREEERRDLPHIVALLAAALRAGAAPAPAISVVGRALPGAAADRLAALAARLELGADPGELWSELGGDPTLGELGRTMARAHRAGAPVVEAVERLGEELAEQARGEVEDRARTVGVRAAVPLGVCLLPAFLLLGIVPLVAALAAEITW
ncbi:type II secretion system F family protein [Nocardioides sambongensis]|uniref:type II secretion system F family protein n=1 Tax=Nocardioides sambongensis TaxID=2589074 RepID=UPI001E339A39|nr:type II secretion system F family protein [Nocardioides sambongensis]